ncbi:MAG: hypothetical protein KDK56_06820 [Simkania sp.]|nr:hypothetical protein [Simkania sp.]
MSSEIKPTASFQPQNLNRQEGQQQSTDPSIKVSLDALLTEEAMDSFQKALIGRVVEEFDPKDFKNFEELKSKFENLNY